MSNPTELPDLPTLPEMPLPVASHPAWGGLFDRMKMHQYAVAYVDLCLSRRAQPEGEAPQAELVELLKAIRPNYGDVGSRDIDVTAQRKRIDRAIELLSAPAGTLSPLCGAQHALDEEDSKLVARGMERLRKGVAGECRLPPVGWQCIRTDGHEGPCAARPVDAQHAEGGKEVLLIDDEPSAVNRVKDLIAAQQAAAPVDCSGTPSSCPDNEGYGCHCSAPGTPEAPKGGVA